MIRQGIWVMLMERNVSFLPQLPKQSFSPVSSSSPSFRPPPTRLTVSATTKATTSIPDSTPNNQLQSSAQQDSAPAAIEASTSTSVNTVSQPSASSTVTTPQLVETKVDEVKEKKQEEEKVTLNERGKIVITGLEGEGGFGVCRPGDEECGGF